MTKYDIGIATVIYRLLV